MESPTHLVLGKFNFRFKAVQKELLQTIFYVDVALCRKLLHEFLTGIPNSVVLKRNLKTIKGTQNKRNLLYLREFKNYSNNNWYEDSAI